MKAMHTYQTTSDFIAHPTLAFAYVHLTGFVLSMQLPGLHPSVQQE
jgi:hypothetical protein